MPERLIVVGNGMVGLRFVEELLVRAAGRYRLTVVGKEPGSPLWFSCRRCWRAMLPPKMSASARRSGTRSAASTSCSARRSNGSMRQSAPCASPTLSGSPGSFSPAPSRSVCRSRE